MKHFVVAALAAPALLCAAGAQAQSAGTWLIKGGVNNISPQVKSGNLSAPSLPGTKVDVKSATSLILTGTYMVTESFSVEGYAGLPYEHEEVGDGAIAGVGKLGTVKQVSPTVFAQYRFMPSSSVRPYVGLGLTYAYFYDEEGSGTLTALTNPGGGTPTKKETDAAFGLSPQIGVTMMLNDKWFLDSSLIKTYLKTTTKLSTGQQIDTDLDPLSFNFSIGYRY